MHILLIKINLHTVNLSINIRHRSLQDSGKFGQTKFARQVIDEYVEETYTHLAINERPVNVFIFKAPLASEGFF